MAKVKTPTKESHKVTFGIRKEGQVKKRYNKHDKTEKNYRGQGR
jgi:hypothetical protein